MIFIWDILLWRNFPNCLGSIFECIQQWKGYFTLLSFMP